MEYEIFLNKVRKELEQTDNYFSAEIDEIIDIVRNSLSNEDIIDINNLEVLLYKFKCYILKLIHKSKSE